MSLPEYARHAHLVARFFRLNEETSFLWLQAFIRLEAALLNDIGQLEA